MISVEIKGVAELNARLAGIADTLQVKVLRDVAQAVYDSAERGADAHTIDGFLRRSVYMHPIKDGYEIGLDQKIAPYAKYVHNGTRPHVIESKPYPFPVFFMRRTKSGKTVPYLKRTKSLRWQHGNNNVFAEKVFHPGYKGDPFLETAVKAGIKYFDAKYGN